MPRYDIRATAAGTAGADAPVGNHLNLVWVATDRDGVVAGASPPTVGRTYMLRAGDVHVRARALYQRACDGKDVLGCTDLKRIAGR